MLCRSQRSPRTVGRHIGPVHHAQDTSDLLIQLLLSHFPLTDQFQIRIGQIILVKRFGRTQTCPILQIQPIENGFLRIMRPTKIRQQHAIKPPFLTKNVLQQIFVMTTMLPIILVVSPHHRPDFSFLNRRLKCRQIDFMQRPFIDKRIDAIAIGFLIIHRKMLHTGSHMVRLNALDIGNAHLGSQIRIFSHILEIPAIHRRTENIHARPQDNILVPV